MEIIYNRESIEYTGNSCENPSRLKGIESVGKLIENLPNGGDLAKLVHLDSYIRRFRKTCNYKQKMSEVITNDFTFEAACAAVSMAVYAADNNSFAAIRPPGHHSSKNTGAGFCFFNNIAIATQHLINQGKRVCLLDIDGHHGDGTERIFHKDERVLFWSIYQAIEVEAKIGWETVGQVRDISWQRKRSGKGNGLINTICLASGSTDKELLYEIDRFIPTIERFKPDHIGISAGFDGYYADQLLQLKFTQEGYRKFGERIAKLNKQTFGVLEGGYHSEVVSCLSKLVEGINTK